MSADYYFFAPTGERYQTVFRGTLPRRYSIKRSRWGNTSPPTIHKPHLRRLQSNHTFPVCVIKKLPRIQKFDTWQRFITTLQAHFVTR